MTDSEDCTMIGLAIVGIVALLLFVDSISGPRYQSPSGLGETLQGRQEGLFE